MIIDTILLIVAIVVAIVFAKSVKEKIRNKEEFSGTGWGLLNGILGIGILFVIIAHSSINKEIAKVKSKKYAEYAKGQMKSFVKTYAICLVIWLIIYALMMMPGRR